MTKLVLGVLDLPYADATSYREVRRGKPRTVTDSSMSTGDVATILEEKYGIMEFFFERHGEEVAEQLLESVEDAIESLHMGAPPTLDPVGAAASAIETRFREMLTNRELDGVVPGVPTLASQEGRSKRFKRPYKKRDPRPSFIDTGLYEGSFRAWVEDE